MEMSKKQLEIYEGWMKFDGEKIEDLSTYITEQQEKRKVSTRNNKHDVEIIVGTDAMIKSDKKKHKKRVISFMSVIVFKNGNNGCHIIKRREEEKAMGYVPLFVKLNGEIDRTAKLALWLRETLGINCEVHLDVNPKDVAGSFEVYKYIKGYFESLDFTCAYKPDSYAAMSAADYLV